MMENLWLPYLQIVKEKNGFINPLLSSYVPLSHFIKKRKITLFAPIFY